MKQTVNIKYKPLWTSNKRYKILMGGRGAGRSTVASQYALSKLTAPEYFRCAIMRYILGDIRNSIYREITDRANESEVLEALTVNDASMVLEYGKNTINAVGFKKSSGDQKAKLKSLANYNTIIIEEADEINEEDFIQLDDSLRTVKGDITIILLLNPPAKDHWIIKRWFDLEPSEQKGFYIPKLKDTVQDVEYIFTDFEDNIKNIDITTAYRYRNYKQTKPDHYYNMIRGYVPETVVGRIFSKWQEIEAIPFEARLERYGLDFGYTNDPTAIVAIYYYNGGYILDEICYQTDMSNRDIANLLKGLDKKIVIADSAEPKSIDEIYGYGITIQPAVKGAGSILNGIQFLKDAKISYTARSKNLKKEYENYAWKIDKNGEVLNEPEDRYNHCFAGNSLVYTTKGKIKIKDLVGTSGYVYSRNGTIQKYSNVRLTRTNTEVLRIKFDDCNTLSVTPDHLLLTDNGVWKEARLLKSNDLIQSGTYGTNIQRKGLQTLQRRELFKSWWQKITQSSMGISQWNNTERISYTSQGQKYYKQRYNKPRVGGSWFSFKAPSKSSNGRTEKEEKGKHGQYKTSNKEMALIKRGNRVAQIAWDRSVPEKKTSIEKVCSLFKGIFHFTTIRESKILSSELQNESKTKKIKRITRGFEVETYNLDVDNTECLVIDGVVAHNCMDSIRYGISPFIKSNHEKDKIQKRVMSENEINFYENSTM